MDKSLCGCCVVLQQAVILPNGTTLVMFRGGASNHTQCRKLGVVVRSAADGNGYPGCTVVGLARADHWAGPCVPLFAHPRACGPRAPCA